MWQRSSTGVAVVKNHALHKQNLPGQVAMKMGIVTVGACAIASATTEVVALEAKRAKYGFAVGGTVPSPCRFPYPGANK